MCIVRRRLVGLRVRSDHSNRVGIDSSSQLHAGLDVDIGSQHSNHCNDSLVESSACDDIHTAHVFVFRVLEYFEHLQHFQPDDIDVLFASNVQNRRNSSSHFSRLDDRERSQQPRHHRR